MKTKDGKIVNEARSGGDREKLETMSGHNGVNTWHNPRAFPFPVSVYMLAWFCYILIISYYLVMETIVLFMVCRYTV